MKRALPTITLCGIITTEGQAAIWTLDVENSRERGFIE
jgi:hypothetical protein